MTWPRDEIDALSDSLSIMGYCISALAMRNLPGRKFRLKSLEHYRRQHLIEKLAARNMAAVLSVVQTLSTEDADKLQDLFRAAARKPIEVPF